MDSFLEATVDRFEGDYAVLRTSDGQELLWSASELPSGVAEGSVVQLALRTDAAATTEREADAKAILNEILGTE